VIAAARGCLLRLEDLHWADADSVALLTYLAGALGSCNVAVIASARDEPAHAVAEPLAASPAVEVLPLARLDPEQVTALAIARHGGAALSDDHLHALVRRSDGLPLLVEELLDGLIHSRDGGELPMPPTLAALVQRRLTDLRQPQVRVVQAAAVLGDVTDWTALSALAGQHEQDVLDALRDAARVHLLIVGDTGRLRWRHALTRDAILATLLPPERAAIAGRAADVLLNRGRPGDDARAADLLERAEQPARAAGVLLALARRDIARGALRSAEQRLDRAARTGTATGEVPIERVRLLTLTGRAAEALEVGAGTVDELAGDEHAELRLRLARAAVATGDWTVAEEHLRRAARPDDPRSLVIAADAAFGDHRPAESAAMADRAVRLAERDGDAAALCEALVVVSRAALTDLAAATAALTRAGQVAAEHGLTPWRVEALRVLGLVQTQTSSTAPALTEARALAEDTGMLATAVTIDMVLADELCTIDGPRAAVAMATDAAERAAALGLRDVLEAARMEVALFHALAGDTRASQTAIDLVLGDPDSSPDAVAAMTAVRGIPQLLAHDLTGANATIDEGVSALITRPSIGPFSLFGVWALLRAVVDDRGEQAREMLRAAFPGVRPINRAAVGYADAVAAGRSGRPDTATARWAEAGALLRGRPWWRRLLHVLVLDAAITDGWGDPVPALRADLAAHEASRDEALARICRTLLRRAGAPTRRGRGDAHVPPALRALGITSREVDVLGLVAEGLTNAQIAERLVLSPRTVETHVAHLLAKTRAAGRADLRQWAERRA
jgi:DNA-binding CsgD family transcriptional regulator/tetratricopeptide (TPR) repeat protein